MASKIGALDDRNPVLDKVLADPVLRNNQVVPVGTKEYENSIVTVPLIKKITVLSLVGIAVLAALFGYIGWLFPSAAKPMIIAGVTIGFIIVFSPLFARRHWLYTPYPLVIYSVAQALMLGPYFTYITRFDHHYAIGQIFLAIVITLGIFIGMLAAYKYDYIHVTPRYRMVIFGLITAVMLVYLTSFIASLFGKHDIFHIFSGASAWPVVWSLLCIVLGALAFTTTFDSIDDLLDMQAPRHFAWALSLALVSNLIWVFLEVFRLIGLLNRPK